ncbi:response regulator [Pseudooceanicola sediminis]|uniref:Response regulator n=1 Tax=Pseudooceanicola sediminis TaxID=2211117 RepID=A0A399J1Z6_9RHOB|nr:response regulator [Pseudooceanicola sediminis]KAA2314733.1 response regulator [Puniceibacterium sp. HSS470]RII39314.1 response regulator [Pseudooceanicola sediminis]|tara:strand:- start:159579 stop:160391 length:813 start_codon:yes stop_codon:yes gene_type:complete
MSVSSGTTDLSSLIGTHLPFLRRYARALTGSQSSGDAYAAATLEAILQDRSVFEGGIGDKAALFKVYHTIWASSGSPVDIEASGMEARAQEHMAKLSPNTREALLLHSIEDFNVSEVAAIMNTDEDEVELLLKTARQEMEDAISGRVLIIEDEAIIAMDLEALVAEMGHRITGVARTHKEAVALGRKEQPDLILADIQLADNSSGIDAVNELLGEFGLMPVIFITAFPERLLTGERPEPAFLISKPYREDQVRSAVSQAMFFASTETLKG